MLLGEMGRNTDAKRRFLTEFSESLHCLGLAMAGLCVCVSLCLCVVCVYVCQRQRDKAHLYHDVYMWYQKAALCVVFHLLPCVRPRLLVIQCCAPQSSSPLTFWNSLSSRPVTPREHWACRCALLYPILHGSGNLETGPHAMTSTLPAQTSPIPYESSKWGEGWSCFNLPACMCDLCTETCRLKEE